MMSDCSVLCFVNMDIEGRLPNAPYLRLHHADADMMSKHVRTGQEAERIPYTLPHAPSHLTMYLQ